MNDAFTASLVLASEDETSALGACLAPRLVGGDTILLKGPIGAGKTHLARAIIQTRLASVGLNEDVPSPTFTLVQTYSDGEFQIWHADLYRLGDPQEVHELGLEDAFVSDIALVEWPEKLGPITPDDALTVEFTLTGETRRIDFSSGSAKWQRIADCLGKPS